MAQDWRPSAWRRKTHDGMSPERAPRDPRGAAPKSIRVTFFPLRETTLATVVTTALNGHDRWDRRDGTFTVELPMWELVGLDTRGQARLLLQRALDALD
jgi:hypothetical protein